MTLDQVLGLMALVGVIVCGVPLYIDNCGGWALYRAERRRKKRAAPKGVQ